MLFFLLKYIEILMAYSYLVDSIYDTNCRKYIYRNVKFDKVVLENSKFPFLLDFEGEDLLSKSSKKLLSANKIILSFRIHNVILLLAFWNNTS